MNMEYIDRLGPAEAQELKQLVELASTQAHEQSWSEEWGMWLSVGDYNLSIDEIQKPLTDEDDSALPIYIGLSLNNKNPEVEPPIFNLCLGCNENDTQPHASYHDESMDEPTYFLISAQIAETALTLLKMGDELLHVASTNKPRAGAASRLTDRLDELKVALVIALVSDEVPSASADDLDQLHLGFAAFKARAFTDPVTHHIKTRSAQHRRDTQTTQSVSITLIDKKVVPTGEDIGEYDGFAEIEYLGDLTPKNIAADYSLAVMDRGPDGAFKEATTVVSTDGTIRRRITLIPGTTELILNPTITAQTANIKAGEAKSSTQVTVQEYTATKNLLKLILTEMLSADA